MSLLNLIKNMVTGIKGEKGIKGISVSGIIVNEASKLQYKRVGSCQRCGRCCRGRPLYDSIINGEDAIYTKELKNLLKVFEADIDKMNCPHCVVNESGFATCPIYKDRPQFCKDFPADIGDLIPNCGFQFVLEGKNAKG